MFERYTEKARRTIFFARFEASQYGSPYIETEHLLLGILREDKALTHRFLSGVNVDESIRKEIEAASVQGKHISTSVDLPLSNEGKRVLAYAAEEAERLSHQHIGTEHLLLGLLREEHGFAAQLLQARGVRLSAVREQYARTLEPTAAARPQEEPATPRIGVDLTEQAYEQLLHPKVGREKEMELLMHTLGRLTKRNAVLVGRPGVGKRAMVEGLAQRIADGGVPSFLAAKAIVDLDRSALLKHPASFTDPERTEIVFFIEGLYAMLAREHGAADLVKVLVLAREYEAVDLVKTALLNGYIQCICCATPEEYRKATEQHRWLDLCFRPIDVRPATEAETRAVLFSAKNRLEKFHSVSYTADAIGGAAHYAGLYIHEPCLPESAFDLIDEAAAYVKARLGRPPQEVVEARKKIHSIVHRMERAIANHEFEIARNYSDEEREQRKKLEELLKKHDIDEDAVHQVTKDDVEEALAGWTGIPASRIREKHGAGPETASN